MELLEQRDVLESSDFILQDALTTFVVDSEEKLLMIASSNKLTTGFKTFSKEFNPYAKVLYHLLPYFLKVYYDIPFQSAKSKPLYPTLVDSIQQLIPMIKSLLWKKIIIIRDADNIRLIPEVMEKMKLKVGNKFEGYDSKVFKAFYSLYTKTETNDDEKMNKFLDTIFRFVNYLDNKDLRLFIRTIETEVKVTQESYLQEKKTESSLTKKLFKTPTPSNELIKSLEKEKPELYKKWRKQLLEVKIQAKQVVETLWVDKYPNIKFLEIPKIIELLKQAKVDFYLDSNFKGKVSMGETPSTMFKYYTTAGLELNTAPGTEVEMNPKYNPKTDDTFYCKHIPRRSADGVVKYIQTYQYMSKSLSNRDVIVSKVAEVIEDVRQTWSKDLKGKDHNRKMIAAICKLCDLTYARIGNKDSEKERDVFGLHILLKKHLKITSSGITISYQGKDKVIQSHKVSDPVIVSLLKKLMEKFKANDHIFVRKDGKPFSEKAINEYLLSIGFPDTFHLIRKYHGNRIFAEALVRVRGKFDKDKAKNLFYSMVDAVAKELGNTRGASMRSYINVNLIIQFWNKVKQPMPKDVATTVRKNTLKRIDEE